MTDTNVTIKAKRGCSDTGITEELATRIYNAALNGKATELVAIVRFTPDYTHEAVKGDVRSVDLAITAIEPVVDGKLNGLLVEHVRTVELALSRNRAIAGAKDEALPFGEEDGPAPKVADIIAQGDALVEKDETGAPSGIHEPDDEDLDDDQLANPAHDPEPAPA
jgi:hypothetical protein